MSGDRKAYRATLAEALEQHVMDVNIPKNEAEHWARREIERLRAGGCARDQRTTQFCAEAVAAQQEIARLRARVEELERELRGIVDFCEEGHRQPYVAIANIARAALKETAP